MSVAMILSSAALGISLVITAVKLVDGFLRADPRLLIRVLTWLLCLIALASIPCLIVLLVYQQWAPAMMLGAGMLVVLTLLNWQSILARTHFPPIWTAAGDLEPLRDNYGQPAPDHELARRAAIVLEDYLAHAGGAPVGLERNARPAPLSHDEALDVLGLERGAAASAIRAAHRRLMQLVILTAAARTISPPGSTRQRIFCSRRPTIVACDDRRRPTQRQPPCHATNGQ